MATGDTGWSEYWGKDGADGEVFVNAQGNRHPALADYWQAVFADVPAGSRIVDVASGAGSIYAHMPADHGFKLHAVYIASEALQVLVSRIPDVRTTVAAAEDMPFDDRSFELVVSQFGIEYAGIDAFAEAARLVADAGRLVVLAHVADGYIDSTNKAQLDEALLTRESEFIRQAKGLTRTAFSNDAKALADKEQEFIPLIGTMRQAVGRCPTGVHAHLLAGFRQLYENRHQYDAADILTWLKGMDGELDKAINRLSYIHAVALSEKDMAEITDGLQAAGFVEVESAPFLTPGNDRPVAWSLTARRAN